MKKTVHLIIILCLCISTVKVYAQPEVTAAGVTPTVGVSLTYIKNKGEYSAGAAGANQIWDLSDSSFVNISTMNFLAPASTDCGIYFPNSTISAKVVPSFYPYLTTFYTYTPNAFQIDGDCHMDGVGLNYRRCHYVNPLEYMHFPMNVNTNYTDSFRCNCIQGGTAYHIIGEASIIVDGYGILITPEATYNDVLRMHWVEIGTFVLGSGTQQTPIKNDYYWWIKDGFIGPIAIVAEKIFGTDTTKSGSYLTTSVGLAPIEPTINEVILYPVPANNELNVQLDLFKNQKGNVKVYNYLGQTVSQLQSLSLNVGNNSIKLDVNAFSNGVYHLQLMLDDGTIETRKFMISH
jgi:hypothetical protein